MDGLGLDDLGICGMQLKNPSLKLVFQINMLLMLLSYCICIFCGYQVLNKIGHHVSGVSNEFQVRQKSGLEKFLMSNVIHDDFQSNMIEESKQLTQMLVIVLIIPFFCQIPAITAKVLQGFMRLNPWVSRACISTFPLAESISPFVMMVKVKNLRSRVKRLFSVSKVGNTNDGANCELDLVIF